MKGELTDIEDELHLSPRSVLDKTLDMLIEQWHCYKQDIIDTFRKNGATEEVIRQVQENLVVQPETLIFHGARQTLEDAIGKQQIELQNLESTQRQQESRMTGNYPPEQNAQEKPPASTESPPVEEQCALPPEVSSDPIPESQPDQKAFVDLPAVPAPEQRPEEISHPVPEKFKTPPTKVAFTNQKVGAAKGLLKKRLMAIQSGRTVELKDPIGETDRMNLMT